MTVFEAAYYVCLCLPAGFTEDEWKELKEWLKVPSGVDKHEF